MQRLIKILERARGLSIDVQHGKIDYPLAEELASECSEFLALWFGQKGFYHDEECADKELVALVAKLQG